MSRTEIALAVAAGALGLYAVYSYAQSAATPAAASAPLAPGNTPFPALTGPGVPTAGLFLPAPPTPAGFTAPAAGSPQLSAFSPVVLR